MSGSPSEASSSIARANETYEWLVSAFKLHIDDSTTDTTTAGTTQDDEKQKLILIQKVVSKRSEDAEEYEPRIVSIGPFHYGKPHLQNMQDLKKSLPRKYVKNSLPITLSFVQVMLRARNCYSDHIFYIDDHYWCMMMFLDTLFIHSFIEDQVSGRSSGRLYMKNHNIDLVYRDLLLLDNQLPLEVLLEFMKINTAFDIFSITKLLQKQLRTAYVLSPIAAITLHLRLSDEMPPQPLSHEHHHLLQLFRDIWINADHDQAALISPILEESVYDDDLFLSVTELKKVGIRCSPGKDHRGRYQLSPSNICFIPSELSGELFLPPLAIREWTKSLLLNLIAYERSSSDESLVISSYLNFMAMLIIQEEDVKELRDRGVIGNRIGSDQAVVDLFKDIKANLESYNPRAFECVKHQIAMYLRSKRHPLRVVLAEFKQRYFGGPWSFLVFLAVIFTVAPCCYFHSCYDYSSDYLHWHSDFQQGKGLGLIMIPTFHYVFFFLSNEFARKH